MAFFEQTPSADLAVHLDCIWTSTTAAGASGVSRILPDGCVEIVVTLDGRFRLVDRTGARRQARVTVVGQNTRPLETCFDDCRRMVGVRLTPAGAFRLLRDALPRIVNGGTDCADIDPRLAGHLSNAVEGAAACEIPSRIERVLRPAIEQARAVDRRIEQASTFLRSTRGVASVTSTADAVGMSTRQLDRSFERCFGLPPKLLARINRFRHAFETGMLGRRGDWAEIAALCGYADQAHLSRDFLEFAGETPERTRQLLTSSDDV